MTDHVSQRLAITGIIALAAGCLVVLAIHPGVSIANVLCTLVGTGIGGLAGFLSGGAKSAPSVTAQSGPEGTTVTTSATEEAKA